MTDEKKIGSRIKELRIKKGLTQKELAGEQITRNMLSLIENGTSCPSVGTLMYLSERLEVPVGYFFTSSPEEEKSYHKSTVIDELKQAFAGKNYTKCIELCAALPLMYADDEISMIAAISYLDVAVSHAEKYAVSNAVLDLTKAAEFSHHTIYLDHSFHKSVEYYTRLFQSLNSTEVPSVLTDLSYASAYVPYEMILYFGMLKLSKGTERANIPFIGGTVYEKHIEAVLLMNEGKAARALKLLKELSQDSTLPYFMQYRVLCDLETAANQVGDLRGAYVSARKKLELIQAAN